MRAGKRPRIAATNGKPTSGKLLLASTKPVQDKLPLNSLEVRSLENSSDQDDNDIRLPPIRAGKGPRIAATNEKPASGKLSSASNKFALEIR